jgi:LysM repeat protein
MKQKQQSWRWATAVTLFLVLAALVACQNGEETPTAAATVPPAATVSVPLTPETEVATTPGGAATAVPTQPDTAVPTAPPLPTTVPEPAESGSGGSPEVTSVSTQHTVQDREWLYQIARCYGTSPQEIVSTNQLPHPGWIMAGEVWTIPNVGSVSTPVGTPCLIYYTVQAGDTLNAIATRYSIPLNMLVFANYGCYGYNAHYDMWSANACYYYSYPTIYPGEVLVIPVTAENVGLRP